MSSNALGDNFNSVQDYVAEMSRPQTYGTTCELEAAGQLFSVRINVFRGGKLLASFGDITEQEVINLRFTGELFSGHFDLLEFLASPDTTAHFHLDFENTKKDKRKRRSRVTEEVRKKQKGESKKNNQEASLQVVRGT